MPHPAPPHQPIKRSSRSRSLPTKRNRDDSADNNGITGADEDQADANSRGNRRRSSGGQTEIPTQTRQSARARNGATKKNKEV